MKPTTWSLWGFQKGLIEWQRHVLLHQGSNKGIDFMFQRNTMQVLDLEPWNTNSSR